MSRPASIGLVDDDPLVLRLLPPQLERHGVVVIWADTAEVALRRLEDHRPQDWIAKGLIAAATGLWSFSPGVPDVLNNLNVLDRVGAAMWGVRAGVIRHRPQTPGPASSGVAPR